MLTAAAVGTAMLMIATQIAGKATRDALFLSNFDVTAVPVMLIGASGLSILALLAFSETIRRTGPAVLVPFALGASSVLFLLEWWLASYYSKLAAVIVFLHMAVFGSFLISGFWSIVNERFDPRSGKRQVARIATGGTIGGLAGGLLTERVGAELSVLTMLPLLFILHLSSSLLLWRFVASRALPRNADHGSEPAAYRSGFRNLAEQPYLRYLAALVLTCTVCATLIDYVFKASASSSYTKEGLLRFFAVYYTSISLVSVIFQSGLARFALERLGVVRTAGFLPLTLVGGAFANFLFPGLTTASIVRGSEATMRNSLFRSAYELLYTPVPPREKRATKPLIDVGFERLGDALGGGLTRAILFLVPGLSHPVMLAAAALLGFVGVVLSRRLQGQYVRTLERSLANHAVDLDISDARDQTTRATLMRSLAGYEVESLRKLVLPSGAGRQGTQKTPIPEHLEKDPLLQKTLILRTSDPQAIGDLLRAETLEAELAPHLIRLLTWDRLATDVLSRLRRMAPQITGQLIDALLNPDEDFAVRRRIPRALAGSPTQRAADGLLAGMEDSRFEVRFQCGRALALIRSKNPAISFAREKVLELVSREVDVERRVWTSQRLLDQFEEGDAWDSFVDDYLKERANRSLEHVFTLLALILPEEPLRIAYRGLHAPDPSLRGTALEYLESVLPDVIRQRLWPFLEDNRTARKTLKSREQVLRELMDSNRSIEISLDELRRMK